jgi:hypothetical protein
MLYSYTPHQNSNEQLSYVNMLQSRLDWCVETERYEMADRFKDLIKSQTTEDEEFQNKYYLKLLKRYASEYPEFYEKVKKKYNISSQ